MKIAIPLQGFERAGGYRVLSELANHWKKLDHEVTFLAPFTSDSPYFPTEAGIIWVDDNGERVAENSGNADLGSLKRTREIVRSLIKGINRYCNDYDVVLANHSFTAWSVFLSRTRARKFYYVQAYEPEYYMSPPRLIGRWRQPFSASTYLLPFEKIVNSPIYFNYKLLRAKEYVPPGIDFSVFFPKPADTGDWQKRRVRLGCIGRKEVHKGIPDVLDAFEILLKVKQDVELHVAYGNLPERKNKLKCTIVVPQNDRELGQFYRSLDIMIAPGTVQLGAAHYPVMEAMACGVPVITTGYMPASSNNAWIVPVHDGRAIAKAVKEIITNCDKRFKHVAEATKDIQEFAWPKVASKMVKIFERALTS